jgi:hypothetical protein
MSDSSSASPFSFLFDGRPSLLLRPFPVLFVYSLFAGVSPVFMVDPASVGGLKVSLFWFAPVPILGVG